MREKGIKIVAVLTVACLITVATIIIITHRENYIDISLVVGGAQLVPITMDVEEITIQNIITHSKQEVKPQLEFYPTSCSSNVKKADMVYEQPFYSDILKKGKQTYLRIFVPQEYYDGDEKVTIDDITVRIYFEGDESNNQFISMGFEPQVTYEYVIITTETFYDTYKDNFVDWKIGNDDKITDILMINVSGITSNPAYWVNSTCGDATNTTAGNHWIADGKEVTSSYSLFNDSQAKIRNFLRHCYNTYSTRYVLLAGNKDIVPVRMVCSYAWSGSAWYNDLSHASDMYYACLHKCMNNDTDNRWMENNCLSYQGDDIDWGYDLCVGRILVDTVPEANLWINKTKNYPLGVIDGNYLQTNIMANRDSGNHITDWNWNYLKYEFPQNLSWVNNQNISESQWDALNSYANGNEAGVDGFQLLYHSGHSGTLYSDYNPTGCSNSATPQFIYTEGCNTGDFGTDTSSRTERWISDDGCAFAGISNSAYGWFYASTYYSKVMFHQMFNDTAINGTTVFCKAHNDARELYGHAEDSVFGMIVKETNYFGDPAQEYVWYLGSPPQVIAIDGRGNGTTVYSANPTFQGSRANASTYIIEIANDSAFTDVFINISNINQWNYPNYYSLTDTKIYFVLPPIYSLEYGKTYYIRINCYIKG